MEKNESIAIPAELYRKAQEKIKGSEFPSVSAYVAFVLAELLSQDEADAAPRAGGMSGEEEAKVKERLRALGYMD